MSETLRGTPNPSNTSNTGTLRGNPNTSNDGTLRGNPNTSNDGTLRGNPNTSNDGTLRGNPNTSNDGTLRGNPNISNDGTLRGKPNDTNDGTLRGKPGTQAGGGTLRGKQDLDKTARGPRNNKPSRGPKPNTPSSSGIGQKPIASNPAPQKPTNKNLQSSSITEFELNEVKYKVDGIISASTGEAEIYCLSKGSHQYALKLYYAGYYPDKQVINTLRQAQGTGFLVDIIDYGQWQSPTGESREYELQPYYTGGDLKPGMMAGNASALKALAVSMIMAVKTAHDHKILHRDLKPGNFMYTDNSRNQLILTDFGIASTFETDGKGRMRPLKTRAQFRTKIYAAPETYVTIDGEIQYDDVKSDYYSLGITLLTLWMGEQPFANYDERTLLRMKKGESGTLPIADDMPPELQHMIKGLTTANPDKRWGFDEFERWLRGEDVAVEGIKQQQSGLNILYSGSKNLIANTFEELVKFMLDDRKLAKTYLYGGKISKWLGDAGYPELQIQIDNFVNKTYPKNQEAGLMAVAYLLDGDLPYEAPTGNHLRTNAEIANDMVYHAKDYLNLMKDPDSSLYVYFRAAGINYADDFVPVAKDLELKAVWRMIFTLDPNSPFPLIDTADGCYALKHSVDEMVDFYATQPANAYATTTSAYPLLLKDEAFSIWLSHRNPALAGKIKSKLSQEKDSEQLYDYIFYLLDPTRNYHFAKDRTKAFTFEQIADMLNDDLITVNKSKQQSNVPGKAEAQERIKMFQNLNNNRLFYYLKSKELYQEHFNYLKATFDLNSKEHTKQAGPYDLSIATYKAIKAFKGNVKYYFGKNNTTVTNLNELDKIGKDELRYEFNNGDLKSWLAVQYQEDPNADLSKDYAYENLLALYTIKIGEIDSSNTEAVRTSEAISIVLDNASKCKSLVRQVKIMRVIWCILIALPLILVAAASIWPGFVKINSTDTVWSIVMLFSTFAFTIRILEIFPYIDRIIWNACSVKLGEYFEDHKWICAISYAGVLGLLFYLLEYYGTSYGFIIMPLYSLGLLALLYNSCIKSMPLMTDQYDNCLNPDDQALVVEPLYYGWKDKGTNRSYESETIENQIFYIDSTKDERNKLIGRTFMALIPVTITVGLYLMMSPILSNWLKVHEPELWDSIYNRTEMTSKTSTKGETYYADVKNSLTVRSKPSKESAALGSLGPKQEIKVLSIDSKTGFAKISWKSGYGYVSIDYIKPVNGSLTTDRPATSQKTSKSVKSDKSGKDDVLSNNKSEDDNALQKNNSSGVAAASAQAANIYTLKANYACLEFYSSTQANQSDIIGEIREGDTFTVLDPTSDHKFAKIVFNGKNGYIMRNAIQKAE